MCTEVIADDKVIKLEENVTKWPLFKENSDLVKCVLNIVDERKETEEQEKEERKQLLYYTL